MADKKLSIYHNPRCSKSREALEIINASGCEVDVINYQKRRLSKKEIKELLAKLNLKPIDIIRSKEEIFIKKFKDKKFTDAEWIQLIIDNPILLERPIVVSNYSAIIARPPKLLEEFLAKK